MRMINITGKKVTLRAVEPSDIESLYQWENDLDVWASSGTASPFSHHTLSLFIESQRQDIFSSRQLRLMICLSSSGVAVGAIDLFEFDPMHLRAGVGIIIAPDFRRRGYAVDALQALEVYAVNYLKLHQLWCNVEEDNLASLALFERANFSHVGIKEQWNYTAEGYRSEIMLQKIL